MHKYILSGFNQSSVEVVNVQKKVIAFVENELPKYLGKIKKVNLEEVNPLSYLIEKKYRFKDLNDTYNFQLFNLVYKFTNDSEVTINVKKNEKYINILANNIILTLDDPSLVLDKLARKLHTILPTAKIVSGEFVDPKNYKFEYPNDIYYYTPVGDWFWLTIYPEKKYRAKDLLHFDDEIYLNIPSFESKKLSDGALMIKLFKEVNASEKIKKQAIQKVLNYYQIILEKHGIWKKFRAIGNWKKDNKELLKLKGFDID